MKIILVIACFISWLLSYYVISRDRTNKLFILFAVFSAVTGMWIFVNLMTGFVPHIFWLRSAYALGAIVPASGLPWLLYLIDKKVEKKYLALIFMSGSVFLILSYAGNLIVAEAQNIYLGGYEGKTGRLFPVYSAYMFTILMTFLWKLFMAYRNSIGIYKTQLFYVFIGAIGFISVSLTVSFLLPLFGILRLTSLDSPSALIFLSLTTYAITRYRLMDINIVIRKSVVYSVSVSLITASFILSVLGFEKLFRHYAGYTTLPVAAVAALIIAFTFYPLKNRIQRIVDKYFYKGAYDYHKVLRDASKAMTSILDLEKLLSYILTVVIDSMKVERGWILLRSVKARKFEARLTATFKEGLRYPSEPPLPPKNILIEYLRRDGEPIVREEMERILPPDEAVPLSKEMKRFNADVAIPIMLKDRLIGAVLLGPKLSGDIYSGEDLQLLSTLANQSAIAIRNAQLYSRLQRDLDTIRYLEREKAKAERLASLGTMAAGIAHEIKNPLVSIKTLAQLLPEKSSDPEFRNEFSQLAIKEIERIDSLVKGLLSLAKPSPPKLEPTDVNSVLDETLVPMTIRMEEGGIRLKKVYETHLPLVMADSYQLKQVFSNILINSIQATPEGGSINIITSWQKESGDKNGHVEIKISDTGVGISQEELDKIFNPFFTTKYEGVGLGLTICHRIIEDHQGSIQVESKEGTGTTFTISLPAASKKKVEGQVLT